ncbi:sulfite exporter TauE/SafE family protein [Paenalcaligenes niemegkensis]|uniref:sulfite exporter TauE/SafE family protein n=1 Tax=Paenalcaligenes niemegkensis TaxID=2895469 RepID=UPI001EE7F010|nr:sulfite exporter TauE/SafE family protein [Paenalcaligenes niemegkensis]MCQ9615722.1 sulfite exporter TauE/SafE family protein [Paenalcaligenes niemegkensis]
MSFSTIALLIAVIAIGTYFQTVTGFGLAMIVIGISSGMELTSVPFIATVVSLISLVNSAVALPRHLHHIDWRIANTTLLGIVPSSIIGVVLLNFLNSQATSILEFLLGAVIVYSGISFALRPKQRSAESSLRTFFMVGFISGLCGGLFGMPGPPIIFLMYRQPMEIPVIRNMLLLMFACTAFSRTFYEVITVGLARDTLVISAMAIPCVALVTLWAQRHPLPLAQPLCAVLLFSPWCSSVWG